MSSYKKYAMMGVSTLLLPLAKRAVQKMISKQTKEPEDDFPIEEERDEFVLASPAGQ